MLCDYCDEVVSEEDSFSDGTGTYHKKCAVKIGYEVDVEEESPHQEFRIGDDQEVDHSLDEEDLVPDII